MAKQVMIDVEALAKMVEETYRAGLVTEEQAGEFAEVVRATAQKHPESVALEALVAAIDERAEETELLAEEKAQAEEIRQEYVDVTGEQGLTPEQAIAGIAEDFELDPEVVRKIVSDML